MPLKPDPDVIKQLVDAVEALERVKVDLDVSESQCPTCGANRANNWEDAKHAKALSAAISRIDTTLTGLHEGPPVVYHRRAHTVRQYRKKKHLPEPKTMKDDVWKDYPKDKGDDS